MVDVLGVAGCRLDYWNGGWPVFVEYIANVIRKINSYASLMCLNIWFLPMYSPWPQGGGKPMFRLKRRCGAVWQAPAACLGGPRADPSALCHANNLIQNAVEVHLIVRLQGVGLFKEPPHDLLQPRWIDPRGLPQCLCAPFSGADR